MLNYIEQGDPTITILHSVLSCSNTLQTQNKREREKIQTIHSNSVGINLVSTSQDVTINENK